MTSRRIPCNRQGTQVPIPQILLFMGSISRNRGRSGSLTFKISTSGTELPLGTLSPNFKAAAL